MGLDVVFMVVGCLGLGTLTLLNDIAYYIQFLHITVFSEHCMLVLTMWEPETSGWELE
jgi:hypothetical protein